MAWREALWPTRWAALSMPAGHAWVCQQRRSREPGWRSRAHPEPLWPAPPRAAARRPARPHARQVRATGAAWWGCAWRGMAWRGMARSGSGWVGCACCLQVAQPCALSPRLPLPLSCAAARMGVCSAVGRAPSQWQSRWVLPPPVAVQGGCCRSQWQSKVGAAAASGSPRWVLPPPVAVKVGAAAATRCLCLCSGRCHARAA